ncbi:MAG TPA: 16S rRNA (cytidine(1402)-2'-O)-methyltransferase [Longimicrobiales bacterium]|nr:16S rRNA (cytidine(1402)-2'-O)-methyltransferase [Longimicrobiales bacterium]
MSTLYLVSTPIGNLGDLSPRATETLRGVDHILAEDTRRSRLLAERAGSTAPLLSLHEHNERGRIELALGWLAAGESVALVSDAGTPLVSDPGARLVEATLEAGHRVAPVPGPSAVLAALVASGFPSERFTFLGFPERKGKDRRRLMERVAMARETVVLFESPRRLTALLEALAESCGPERRVAVARELTKVHEEIVRGTLDDVATYYREHPPRGEVTLVLEPARDAGTPSEGLEEEARSLAAELLAGGARPSSVARELTARLDLARNEAYRIVQDLQGNGTP